MSKFEKATLKAAFTTAVLASGVAVGGAIAAPAIVPISAAVAAGTAVVAVGAGARSAVKWALNKFLPDD